MSQSLATVAYLGAAILFILSLGGLSNPETSRRGNLFGMVGMALAVPLSRVRAFFCSGPTWFHLPWKHLGLPQASAGAQRHGVSEPAGVAGGAICQVG